MLHIYNSKIFMLVMILLSICIFSVGVYTLIIRIEYSKINLNYELVEIEFGEKYVPNIKDIVYCKDQSIDLQKLTLTSNIKYNDFGIPIVGRYINLVKYKGMELKQEVVVLDTTPPEILVEEPLRLELGSDVMSYIENNIVVKDLSELINNEIDISTVNENLIGEYNAKVFAKDVYNNENEKSVKIIIENKQESKEMRQNDVTKKSDSFSIVNDQKAKSKSSESQIENISQSYDKQEDNNSTLTDSYLKEEKKENELRCTSDINHSISIGNSGKWYNTKKEAITEYNEIIKYWSKQWESNQIDDETYKKNCPYGYEIYSCAYCGKWSINYYYR